MRSVTMGDEPDERETIKETFLTMLIEEFIEKKENQ